MESNEGNNSKNARITVLAAQDTNPPPVPALYFPRPGIELSDDTPRLRWQNVSDPEGNGDEFDVQVSTNSSFRNVIRSISDTNTASYTVEPSLSPGWYYWRVRSEDLAGNIGDWSTTRRFLISESPINVVVNSIPAGRQVTVDGSSQTTPYTASWEPESRHTLNAPYSQLEGDSTYIFSRWSDGGTQERTVRPARDITYTAVFDEAPPETDTNLSPEISAFSPAHVSLTVENGQTEWTFSATGFDIDNNLNNYQWFLDEQPTGIGGWELTQTSEVTYTTYLTKDFSTFEPGTYEVKVTYTDDVGESASVHWDVEVPRAEEESNILLYQPIYQGPITDSSGDVVAEWRIQLVSPDTGKIEFIEFELFLSGVTLIESGSVSVALPKSAWIHYGGVKKWTRTFESGWEPLTAEREHESLRSVSVAFSTGEFLLSFIPHVGHVVGAFNYISELYDAFEPEQQQNPKSYTFSKEWLNCTSRITVPWYVGRTDFSDPIDRMRITIPVEFADLEFDPLEAYASLTIIDHTEPLEEWILHLLHGERLQVETHEYNTQNIRCNPSQSASAKAASAPRITVSPLVLTLAEGGNATYTVQLSAEPDGNVSVEIDFESNADISVIPRIMSFDADDWNQPREVTVRALQDDDADRDAPIELVHTAFGSDRAVMASENVVVAIEEDDPVAVQVQPSGPRWLSSATEITPRSGTGGSLEVRVLTLDTTSAPEISISSPELSRTRRTNGCSLQHRPPGFVPQITRCWHIFFNLPVNDSGSTRAYTITAQSTDITEDLVVEVSVSPTPSPETVAPEQTASVAEAVAAGLAPLGSNLKWALHFDSATQEWLDYNPDSPSTGTLNQLVPGEVYWFGVNEDQTVVLGGASRTLKTGLNQIVW